MPLTPTLLSRSVFFGWSGKRGRDTLVGRTWDVFSDGQVGGVGQRSVSPLHSSVGS